MWPNLRVHFAFSPGACAAQVLGNLAFNIILMAGRVIKYIFLGKLRDAEVRVSAPRAQRSRVAARGEIVTLLLPDTSLLQALWRNSRFAVAETCIALMIFKEELNMQVRLTTMACFLTWPGYNCCASESSGGIPVCGALVHESVPLAVPGAR
jgi:hypothetical protein